jgi:hypothetical protein
MAIEEMLDYLKTLFSDLKFNDLLVKFCSEKQVESAASEGDNVIFVDIDKVMKLNEVLGQLPVIIRRDGNVSNSMNLLINEDKLRKE